MQMRVFAVVAVAGALALAACGKNETAPGTSAPGTEAAGEVPLLQLPHTVVPVHYRLDLTILPESARFTGHAEIDVTFHQPMSAMYLHGRDLVVHSVKAVLADGSTVAAHYEQVHETGVARLTFEKEVPTGNAKLVFDYDAPFNTSLQGLYKVVDAGDNYIFSQFENIDARRAYPGFDEPGFKTPFDVSVTAPGADQVVCNTLPVKEESLPGGMKRVTFATTKPLPTYLVEFSVGPLDVVEGPAVPPNDLRPAPLRNRGVTVRGKGDQIHYAIDNTPALVDHLEHYFHRAYPFDKLDQIAAADFAAGGMENAGAIAYRETRMLLNAQSPLDQRRGWAGTESHEVSHMWFGDLVTAAWWDNIWLNEAFATWMGHKMQAQWFPDGEYSRLTLASGLNVMRLDSLPSSRRIREPIKSVDDIDNAFDDITYSKGAAVLGMFESYVGEDAFRDGVRLHIQRHAYGNATTDEFLQSIADGSHHPEIVAAFHSFIDQPNVPLVTVHAKCGAGGNGTVSVSQTTDAPIGTNLPARVWQIPLCMRATGGAGQKSCTLVTKAQMDLAMPLACAGAIMPNAEGAGYYHFTMDEAGWEALIANAGKLDAAEQVTLLRNLEAGVRAGNTRASMLFAGMRAIAPTGSWDALDAIEDILKRLHDSVVAPADRATFEAFARALIRPRLDAVGLAAKPGQPAANALIRTSAVAFLVNQGGDAQLRAELAPSGEAYMTSGGKAYGTAPSDVAQYALWSAVAQGGPDFTHRLMAAMKASTDQQFRSAGMFALTAVDDPAVLREVYGLVLSADYKMNENGLMLRYLDSAADRRAGVWQWVEANTGPLEAHFSASNMDGVVASFDACDAGMRDDYKRVFGPRIARYEGAPRSMAQAIEATNRCIAFKNAKAAEIAAAFKATPAVPHG